MESEYERMKKGIAEAKHRRIEGHDQVLQLLHQVYNDCLILIEAEKNEREETQNSICTLLEDTCNNLESRN